MSTARPARHDSGPNDALEQAHARLSTAVEQLVSGEDWQAMLAIAARFHAYSHRNVLLLMVQCAERGIEPTRFAGYRAWQALGHQVRRGEHGFDILAPVLRRSRDDEPEHEVDVDAPAKLPSDDEQATRRRNVLAGFKVAKVFELSQTDGAPLPDVAPKLLVGDAPVALYAGLAREVEGSGFRLLREDCSPANGRTDLVARTVTVRPDCSPAQAAKTLAHELGHVRLHDEPRFSGLGGTLCRGQAEVEAESVAFLVCATAGLPSDGYSFPYVARWANGDVELVRAAGERSLRAAREIGRSLGLVAPANDAASERVLEASRAAQPEPSRTVERGALASTRLGPSKAGPSQFGPSRSGPSRSGPSRSPSSRERTR